jgi:PmbA protein
MNVLKADDFKKLVEDLVRMGKDAGADEVEAALQQGSEFSVDVRLGEIENMIEAGSCHVSVKIIAEKKTALTTSSDLDRSTLEALIKNAVQRAALGSPDEYAGLPPASETSAAPDNLELYDPSISQLDSEKKIALARNTERIAMADKRIINSHGAGFETREIRTILANSHGFSEEFSETYCSLGLGLQAGDTDNLVEGYWGSAKRHFSELDSLESIAQKAVERTIRQLGSRKIQTQVVPVLFEPEMTAWLMGFLFSCVSGVAVYNRATFLADRLGEHIAGSQVSVSDNGLLPKLLGSSPFDTDGIASQNTPVIERGILRNFLCNTYAARKLGLRSTGNASGSSVSPSNFYLYPGEHSQERMIKSLDKGMILIRVLGHGLNPITGDISRGAFGLWVEKGEIVYPVSEVTISGNLGSILNNISQIGNDLDFQSSICGPSIRVEDLTIAGL